MLDRLCLFVRPPGPGPPRQGQARVYPEAWLAARKLRLPPLTTMPPGCPHLLSIRLFDLRFMHSKPFFLVFCWFLLHRLHFFGLGALCPSALCVLLSERVVSGLQIQVMSLFALKPACILLLSRLGGSRWRFLLHNT